MSSVLSKSLLAAEELAAEATALPSFPINLLDVRRNVEHIMSEFRHYGFFDEFTVHDFSHCLEMIRMLDWIILPETKKVMSEADWLLIVLACYFHDMGLLITRDEFDRRNETDFPRFCREELFGGSEGKDYEEKVRKLSPEKMEQFLYQEFVRENHGKRIRAWIEGKPAFQVGFAEAAFDEVQSLLGKLPSTFKRDLALVCESHNLDDLHDTKKYGVSQPYGNSEEETANVQYSAVLLRTVDLLQVTQHRTPAVLFRLINPTDPISQREWAKQGGVTRIRPRIGLDKDGNPNPNAPVDSIEIFAEFQDDIGFFGLTSYLVYARGQLRKSFEVVEKSRRVAPRRYAFPWKDIDDSHVEARGFLKQTFGFSLDQAKILDLLTGHTLYNDSNVVVRELMQNAIDAVRLQAIIDQTPSNVSGQINVKWSNSEASLEIADNGTGMSQDTIENHLLKVGASKYQNTHFKEMYPTFSSISRFGIGVLSAFMVADTVEIVTRSADDDNVRQISLRSVHGRYLIRLLDQDCLDAKLVTPHGTIVRLKFRASAKRVNIVDAMHRWIKFPRCSVQLSVDEGTEVQIGHDTLGAALAAYFERVKSPKEMSRRQTKIVEKELEGVSVAYALEWSETFRDWTFARTLTEESKRLEAADAGGGVWPMCTCVEGIAVVSGTPGFEKYSIVAIANAVGHGAPKTNVARSSIEDTEESKELTRKIYEIYVQQIADEAERLVSGEKYSISWASSQIPFLVNALVSGDADAINYSLQREALKKLPMFVIESEGRRRSASLAVLKADGSFWTVESEMTRSAERILREASTELTLKQLMEILERDAPWLPEGVIVCNFNTRLLPFDVLLTDFEIDGVQMLHKERRLHVKWHRISDERHWVGRRDAELRLGRRAVEYVEEMTLRRARWARLFVANREITQQGLDEFVGFHCHQAIYILPNQPAGQFLTKLAADREFVECFVYSLILVDHLANTESVEGDDFVKSVKQWVGRVSEFGTELKFEAEFIEAASSGSLRLADPLATSTRFFDFEGPWF